MWRVTQRITLFRLKFCLTCVCFNYQGYDFFEIGQFPSFTNLVSGNSTVYFSTYSYKPSTKRDEHNTDLLAVEHHSFYLVAFLCKMLSNLLGGARTALHALS